MAKAIGPDGMETVRRGVWDDGGDDGHLGHLRGVRQIAERVPLHVGAGDLSALHLHPDPDLERAEQQAAHGQPSAVRGEHAGGAGQPVLSVLLLLLRRPQLGVPGRQLDPLERGPVADVPAAADPLLLLQDQGEDGRVVHAALVGEMDLRGAALRASADL